MSARPTSAQSVSARSAEARPAEVHRNKSRLLRFACLLIVCILTCASFTTAFMTIRSTLLLCDGLREVERINRSGSYTANLFSEHGQNTDTNNGLPDTDTISDDAFNRVYDFMNDHTDYALYSDGYIAHLSQMPSGNVSVTYLNKQYYQLADFLLYQGTALNFDYLDGENAQEIPVLVGYGVGEKYPVGSRFTIDDFSAGKMRRFRVQGVLKKDNVSSLF